MDIQIGTVSRPFSMVPRIDQAPVTVTQIKSTYSTKFINNIDTPLTFHLELTDKNGVVTVIDANPSETTDSVIVYDIPNATYAVLNDFTILFYWSVIDTITPPFTTIIEKIYTEQPLVLKVTNLHT